MKNYLLLFVVIGLCAASAFADAPGSVAPDVGPELLSQLTAKIIASELPREYERRKDWGQTKKITTGVRSSGNFFDFDIHRKKSEVNHGVWKHYRLTLVEPDKNLAVKIENLRMLEAGRMALTLDVAAKVHGWARMKVYERGVHIIALEAEGDTDVRLSIDGEIGMHVVQTDSILPGYAIDPVVTDVRLKFKDFELKRISDVRGAFAHEIGIMLREAVEDELKGKKLADKINRSIEKKRDRLQLTPEMLLGKWDPKEKPEAEKSPGAK